MNLYPRDWKVEEREKEKIKKNRVRRGMEEGRGAEGKGNQEEEQAREKDTATLMMKIDDSLTVVVRELLKLPTSPTWTSMMSAIPKYWRWL